MAFVAVFLFLSEALVIFWINGSHFGIIGFDNSFLKLNVDICTVKSRPSFYAHLALFVAQVIYALNYVIAKDLMPTHIAPLGLVLLRITGACLLFWTASLFVTEKKIEKSDFKRIFLMALFGVVINQGFFIYGLSITEPINSAIIMISNPILVAIFTFYVLKERFTIFKTLGMVMGMSGALLLLLFKGNFKLGSNTWLGDVFTLCNSISWAVFIVLAQPMMKKYHTVTVMKWMFLLGTVIFFGIGFKDWTLVHWSELSSNVVWAMVFVVVATTFLAYLLNTWALKQLSPSVVSMYIYLQPFLAGMFAILMQKDTLTPIKLMAGGLIILGVYLVSKKK